MRAGRKLSAPSISSARDPAALEEVRVRTLGKSGWLTEKLKELGKLAAEQRKEARRALQSRARRDSRRVIEKKRAELEQARGRRKARARNASTSRCRAAARRAAGCIRSPRCGCRIEQLFRQAGLHDRDRPRDRRRLPQLRGAEHSRGSSGARDARHLLLPRRQAAAHAYLAGADPRHAGGQAAVRGDRAGARVSQRSRRHALADVSPGRRPGGRRGHHLREHEGHAAWLPRSLLRARPQDAAASVVLSFHRAFGRSRHELRVVRRRGLPRLQAHRLARDLGLRHGASARAARPAASIRRSTPATPSAWASIASRCCVTA